MTLLVVGLPATPEVAEWVDSIKATFNLPLVWASSSVLDSRSVDQHIALPSAPDVRNDCQRGSLWLRTALSAVGGSVLIVTTPFILRGEYDQALDVIRRQVVGTTLDRECVPCTLRVRPYLEDTLRFLVSRGRVAWDYENGLPWYADAQALLDLMNAQANIEPKTAYLNLHSTMTPLRDWSLRGAIHLPSQANPMALTGHLNRAKVVVIRPAMLRFPSIRALLSSSKQAA